MKIASSSGIYKAPYIGHISLRKRNDQEVESIQYLG